MRTRIAKSAFEEAREINARATIGTELAIPLKTKDFGYIAVGAAKNVIRQGIKEAEKEQLFADMQGKIHELVTGTVLRISEKSGAAILQIGSNEFVLPKEEQIPGEVIEVGDSVKVYVADVVSTERGPKIMLSRTHSNFVARLFELEVPEIFDGTVEINSISREAGRRTKMAVWSKDENVDPIGACIGSRRARIESVLSQLNGEKIDIIKYSEDPAEFIKAALSPSRVTSVEIISRRSPKLAELPFRTNSFHLQSAIKAKTQDLPHILQAIRLIFTLKAVTSANNREAFLWQ